VEKFVTNRHPNGVDGPKQKREEKTNVDAWVDAKWGNKGRGKEPNETGAAYLHTKKNKKRRSRTPLGGKTQEAQ